MRAIRRAWALVSILGLSTLGCASVPLAPEAAARQAKSFAPPPGKGQIYVYRRDGFTLSAITLAVDVNGSSLGVLKVGTFLLAVVAPGTYQLVSQSENEAPVSVTVEVGKNYFFQQEVSFGSAEARSVLVHVDEATGRGAVGDLEMAASLAPPAAGEAAPGGCVKDTDCKGDRICDAGRCTAPPP